MGHGEPVKSVEKLAGEIAASKTVATITMVVDYEDLPDSEAIDGLLEAARSYGEVRQATLEVKKGTKADLRNR